MMRMKIFYTRLILIIAGTFLAIHAGGQYSMFFNRFKFLDTSNYCISAFTNKDFSTIGNNNSSFLRKNYYFSRVPTTGSLSNFKCNPMETPATKTERGNITLFPNPASTVIHLTCEKTDLISNIAIFDATGQMVVARNAQTSQESVDLSALPKGLYFVKISTQKSGEHMKRLVKL